MKVVPQNLWHHPRGSTALTNAIQERKFGGQLAFEGLEAHSIQATCVDDFKLLKFLLRKTIPRPAAEDSFPTAQSRRSKAEEPAQQTAWHTIQNLFYAYCQGRHFIVNTSIQQNLQVEVLAYFALRRKEEWKHSYWTGTLGLSRGYRRGKLSNSFLPHNGLWFDQHSVTVQYLN